MRDSSGSPDGAQRRRTTSEWPDGDERSRHAQIKFLRQNQTSGMEMRKRLAVSSILIGRESR